MTRQKIIDLLAMSRFANLPTVWSNGLLGVLIGWAAFRTVAPLEPLSVILLGFSLSALYLGGCFFNDWHDLDFDQKTRPDRPIPSGRWPRHTVLLLALGLMGGGLVLGALVCLPSALFCAGIILCILAYTKWHKAHPASFLFMAGARALIYPAAAFSLISWEQFLRFGGTQSPVLISLGLGLGGYILGISLTARSETSTDAASEIKKNLPVVCLCAPILFFSIPFLAAQDGFALIPLLVFVAVIATLVRQLRANHEVGTFVSRALAAIPLVDFLFVFPFAPHPVFWVICLLLALAALGLQKIAPAT